MDKKKILDNSQIKRKIKRISLQIIESNINEKEIILAGVEKNGFLLAKELNKEINNLSDLNTIVCNIKIDKKLLKVGIARKFSFFNFQLI